MRSSLKITAKIALAVVAICGVLAVWRVVSLKIEAPSDNELLKVFQAHRGELETLRQMATEDMPRTSSFSESSISDTLPEARRNQYRVLLRVYPGLVIGVNYDQSVRFVFASKGVAIGPGWAKGIQFIPDTARLIGTRMSSLDGAGELRAGVYLREIEPQWFAFYQRDE